MARSVLRIEVEDESFKRFHEEFKKYEKARLQVSKTSLSSKKDNKEEEESLKRRNALIVTGRKAAEAGAKIQAAAVAGMARSWEAIAARSKAVAASVHQTTLGLTRQVALGAAVGSLIGVGGGIWGLDRLAQSAGSGRRSSTGRGLSYGDQQAFGLTYGRLVDTGSFLGGVSNARGNIASGSYAAMLNLGLDPSQGSAGDVASRALDAVRRLAKNTPENLLGVLPQSHMLGELGLDVEDLRRLKTGSDEEYSQFSGEYTKRRRQLNVGDPALKASQDFAIQLDVAGEKIKSGLIAGLEKLMPNLTKLSDVFSDVAQDILGSKGAKAAVDYLAGGLREFGDYIQKEEFKQDIKSFVAGIGAMADAITRSLKLLGVIPTQETEQAKKIREAAQSLPGGGGGILGWLLKKSGEVFGGAYGGSASSNPAGVAGAPGRGASLSITDPQMKAIANTVAFMESRGGPNNGYGSMGPAVKAMNGDQAHGRYGVMGSNIPSWSREALGRTLTKDEFLRDPKAQDAIFEFKMRQFIKEHGTVQDAFSVWHSGRPLAQATAAGAADQNMTTASYAAKANARLKIELNDNTGGNVIPQVNQIAY